MVEKTFRSREGVPPDGIEQETALSGTQETGIRKYEYENYRTNFYQKSLHLQKYGTS
ncbi:MAG: hypothetical protein GX660_16780 [Clostridiaceae bacterium]|nr:hypothetical protein [Clostridiaceae bacterium]